jgi:hypothetical protein
MFNALRGHLPPPKGSSQTLGADQGLNAHAFRHNPQFASHPPINEAHHLPMNTKRGHGSLEHRPISPTPDGTIIFHRIFHGGKILVRPEKYQNSAVSEFSQNWDPTGVFIPKDNTGAKIRVAS